MSKPFKIIVCGGGPIGLMVAHALGRAGVDYVVLEQEEEIARDLGASIIVYQGTLRIMSQLGLLERVREVGTVLTSVVLGSVADARPYGVLPVDMPGENFGADGIIVDRAKLLRVVYDSLDEKDKSKVLMGKKATQVVSRDDGVTVTCADGTSYEGSMVIGADGVGSVSRKAIRSLALATGQRTADMDEERPFLSSYRALWFSTPRPERISVGSGAISFGSPASIQVVTGDDTSYIFLYERLRTDTKEKVVYTDKDIGDMVRTWGHLLTPGGYRVDHLFAKRERVALINLDEGVVKTWSAGRIVLVGDAVHKFTPSSALGYNNGIQDVAVALNEIIRLVHHDGNPSVEALEAAFARYQATRTSILHKDYQASAMATRSQSYDNVVLWAVCVLLVPYFGFLQRFLINVGVNERLRESWPLEFLPGTEPFHGKIPWKHPMKGAGKAG